VWPVRSGQCGLSGDSTLCLPKSGQTISFVAKDDGDLQRGVAWPSPRFVDNADGTVTDKLTGLMWTKDANLPNSNISWYQAIDFVKTVNAGNYTDWRLPNVKEIESLLNAGESNIALWLTGQGFTNVQSYGYWSSTTSAFFCSDAWTVNFSGAGSLSGVSYKRAYYDYYYGWVYPYNYVWPVRGGQRGGWVEINHTDRVPAPSLVTLPPNGQLIDISANSGIVDPSKPTVVITHGWQPEPTDISWIERMAVAIKNNPDIDGSNMNIVWWNWLEKAISPFPTGPAYSAPSQGTALGKELYRVFGQNYNQPIHFIGHSLGTVVNKRAIDYLLSPEQGQGWDSSKIQVTILDAPDMYNLYIPTLNCIPNQYQWIDIYVTAFGDIHSEATSVILSRNSPAFNSDTSVKDTFDMIADYHSYAHDWYIESIKNSCESPMGFRCPFEKNGATDQGQCFEQSKNTSDSVLKINSFNCSDAQSNLGRHFYITADGIYLLAQNTKKAIFITIDAIRKSIDATINVTIEAIGKVVDGVTQIIPKLTLTQGSPAYAWIPLTVPANVTHLSFDFSVQDQGNGEFMSAGINDQQLLALELQYVEGQGLNHSGLIDISQYAGQDVELFFGLNSAGENHAQFTIENIQFYTDNSAPTVIKLSSFTATPKAGKVILQWNTESETNNAGFNIYRAAAASGEYFKINTSLITANGSATQSAAYQFIDKAVKNSNTYYYKLEDIDLNGKATMHGPVSATPKWIFIFYK